MDKKNKKDPRKDTSIQNPQYDDDVDDDLEDSLAEAEVELNSDLYTFLSCLVENPGSIKCIRASIEGDRGLVVCGDTGKRGFVFFLVEGQKVGTLIVKRLGFL